jgi:anthranilate phosphoribosyltransferase
MTIRDALAKLVLGQDLSRAEARAAMTSLVEGEATPSQIAGFAIALRMKGETPEEIAGLAEVMRAAATHVDAGSNVVDVVGTGGDGAGTFNISTLAALLVASAGARVAKHGNRGVSSGSGSADVLEALGAQIVLTPEKVAACLEETGIGFMFAPNHHAAMKHAAPVRKELGVRTIFNILGPLTNPASAPNQLMGVFHPDLVGIQVRVLQQLGSDHVLVVYGKDGMDEVSLGATTLVGELKDGQVLEYEIHPEDFGLAMVSNRGMKVSNPDESRAMVLEALNGTPGTPREIVTLNAGVALYASDAAASIGEGIGRAREAIASGAARKKLDQFVEATRRLAAG